MLDQQTYDELICGLKQYLWFLGQDTLDPQNNLLEEYGFHKYRTPGHAGTSRYKIKKGERTVELHSFCVGIYGDKKDDFLFVRANDTAYTYLGNEAPLPGNYQKELLSDPRNEENKDSFLCVSCEFLEWLNDYETWVSKKRGETYREDCYHRYHKK